MTKPVTALTDAYAGQTCYVVGKGPSLLHLTAAHFPEPGPVIAINHAIRTVQRLRLPNPVLSMQKDGRYPFPCPQPCTEVAERMVWPPTGALLLVSATTTPNCFAGHRRRYVFDEAALGLKFTAPSAVVAIRLAELFGCARLVLLAFDAAVTGCTDSVVDGRAQPGQRRFAGGPRLCGRGPVDADAAGDQPD
jgi:hypothetical protein